ncbi:MAG: putative Ig domain-containing protein [Candidatus Methylacidiphilales bacterium]|nr:putative Ig domain-containing protein [Candidatus Methylacidiphilales bacterium]
MSNPSPTAATPGRKFPDIAQYRTAVQGLHFNDAELLTCTPKLGKLKKPLHYSGAFAVAFPLLNGAGAIRYAVRFWTQRVPGNTLQRYNALSSTLQDNPELEPHFARFDYVEDGVKVLMSGNMETYPLLRMDWVGGETPKEYITRAMGLEPPERKKRLTEAIAAWRSMLMTLQMHGVAHGDLWNDNIRFVTDDTTRQVRCVLLDYDSIYVPQLVHPPRVTGSVSGYRNPFDATTEQLDSSDDHESAECDDYFSGFALLVSLEGLAENALLWQEFGGRESGENAFLFREKDFAEPDNSALISRLREAEGTSLKRFSQLLYDICKSRFPSNQLLPLSEMLKWDAAERLGFAPTRKPASAVITPGSSHLRQQQAPQQPPPAQQRPPEPKPDWRAHLQAHLHSLGLTGLTIQPRGGDRWSITGNVQDAGQRRLALQKCQETESPFIDEISIDPNAYVRLEQQMHSVGLKQLTLRQTSTGWEVHGTVPTQEQYNMARHICDNSMLPLSPRFLYVPLKARSSFSLLALVSIIIFLLLLCTVAAGVVFAPQYLSSASLFTTKPPVHYTNSVFTHLKTGSPLEVKPEGVTEGDRFSATSLPSEFKLNESTGVITGTPTSGGEHQIEIKVVRNGATSIHNLYIQIDSAERVTYPVGQAGNLKIGTPVQILPAHVVEGDRFTAQGLPAGLQLDPATGIISGTIQRSGKANSIISVTRKGDDHKVEIPFSTDAPPFPAFAKRYEFRQNQPVGPVLPELAAGSPYPPEAYKFEMPLDQSLPVGLTIDPRGQILGKPAAAGTTTCLINISLGEEKKTVQVTFNIVAEPPVVVEKQPEPEKPVDPPQPPATPPPPVTEQTPLHRAQRDPSFNTFIENWMAAQFSNRSSDWGDSFAPRAMYTDRGKTTLWTRAAIQQDRQTLIAANPERQYEKKSVEVSSYTDTEISCVIVMRYNYGNGAKRGLSTLTLNLKKEEGRWYIVYFFEKVDKGAW